MKKNSKLAVMLLGASILGSATTMFATSAIEKAKGDVFIPSQEKQEVQESNFVNTASSRAIAVNTPDFTTVAENTINSVVSIKNYATVRQQNSFFQGDDWDPFEFFFGPGFGGGNSPRQKKQQTQPKTDSKPQLRGSGSGVIISEDGYIVTNNHVVEGAEKLTVTLNDDSEYNARVIGTDPNTDVALIKISATGLHPVTFANSDNVKVGEWALAVGNPFGFNSTVTAGIISAKGRGFTESSTKSVKSFIQHDAAVNQGNSGGALVNTSGELIGINTMIYSHTGDYNGCSFAIPSNTVKKIVTDLKQHGTVQRAMLGISYTELDAERAKEEKITATNNGIYVEEVTDRSAAKEAGLKKGDVIVKLNDATVKNSGELQEQMNKLRPGDKATISYYRDNKLKTTTVTLKNDQGNTNITKNSDFTSLGCAFQTLTAQEKEDLNISQGVKVVALKDGKFKNAGIKEGFIITDINDTVVNSSDDVEEIYNTLMRSKGRKVMVVSGLLPTGKTRYYAVDIADDEDE